MDKRENSHKAVHRIRMSSGGTMCRSQFERQLSQLKIELSVYDIGETLIGGLEMLEFWFEDECCTEKA